MKEKDEGVSLTEWCSEILRNECFGHESGCVDSLRWRSTWNEDRTIAKNMRSSKLDDVKVLRNHTRSSLERAHFQ